MVEISPTTGHIPGVIDLNPFIVKYNINFTLTNVMIHLKLEEGMKPIFLHTSKLVVNDLILICSRMSPGSGM